MQVQQKLRRGLREAGLASLDRLRAGHAAGAGREVGRVEAVEVLAGSELQRGNELEFARFHRVVAVEAGQVVGLRTAGQLFARDEIAAGAEAVGEVVGAQRCGADALQAHRRDPAGCTRAAIPVYLEQGIGAFAREPQPATEKGVAAVMADEALHKPEHVEPVAADAGAKVADDDRVAGDPGRTHCTQRVDTFSQRNDRTQ